MRTDTRHHPGFAVARCSLAPGETLTAQSGSMYACSAGIEVDAKSSGGILAGLKRAAVGGSSLFLSHFTAQGEGCWVDLAHRLPGDVVAVDVTPDQPLQVTQGSWLGCSPGVEPQTKWAGMQNLFGGEGGFTLRMDGAGSAVLGCYGALDALVLAPGEQVTVATGHIVAYDSSTTLAVRRLAAGRTIRSLKTGQFLVCDFTGPGRVFLQTRNPKALVAFVQESLPKPDAEGVQVSEGG
ncbi:TIGR00266 family protein [Kitasatospora sp. NPDC048540]|uniref:TIGR00266 family protein n=1 Tax=Kitasatospora sp. NPDC048540 TaxID=3155634 RepID=UPI0033D079B0